MSRRLILMRHAKSSWKTGAPSDHARPLNKRGRRDAPRIAAVLETAGWWPQRVLTSDSARTLETWALMAEGRPEVELRAERSLYLAGILELRPLLSTLEPEVETVLTLGHNPGWEDALAWLSGEDPAMTTGNAALLESSAPTWAEAFEAPASFDLVRLLRPRELPKDRASEA